MTAWNGFVAYIIKTLNLVFGEEIAQRFEIPGEALSIYVFFHIHSSPKESFI